MESQNIKFIAAIKFLTKEGAKAKEIHQRMADVRAWENRKNSRSGPKLRILDRFQTPQNANKSVQQVCALNPIFPQPTQFSRINDV